MHLRPKNIWNVKTNFPTTKVTHTTDFLLSTSTSRESQEIWWRKAETENNARHLAVVTTKDSLGLSLEVLAVLFQTEGLFHAYRRGQFLVKRLLFSHCFSGLVTKSIIQDESCFQHSIIQDPTMAEITVVAATKETYRDRIAADILKSQRDFCGAIPYWRFKQQQRRNILLNQRSLLHPSIYALHGRGTLPYCCRLSLLGTPAMVFVLHYLIGVVICNPRGEDLTDLVLSNQWMRQSRWDAVYYQVSNRRRPLNKRRRGNLYAN